MRLRGSALLLLLLLASPAAASAEQPHVESPRDRARDPSGDLLAAWLESDPAGLRISFRVADLDARETLRAYAFVLRIDGTPRAPAIGFDPRGDLRTDSGSHPDGWGSPRMPARVDDTLRSAAIVRSEEGDVLTAVVPWGLHGLREGSSVVPVSASVSLYSQDMRRWIIPYDLANASRAEPLRVMSDATAPRGIFPILVPAWVIPTIVVGLTVGGTLGGAALGWATRPRAPTPTPPAPAARAPPPPPGRRFRKAP